MDRITQVNQPSGSRMKNSWLSAVSIVLFFCVAINAQDSPLVILDHPKPELPQGYGSLDAQGAVRLKVEFLSNGQIGNIVAISKMPVANLTELAIDAARRIRFNPEIKSGNKVIINRLVEYSYSWNGFWKIPVVLVLSVNRKTSNEPAEMVLRKAAQNLGGDRYLKVTSQIGRGKFSIFKDKALVSFQTFVDVIVFPDKERTEFKGGGKLTIQVNSGAGGWIYDGEVERVKDQTETQLNNFKQGIRTSLDNLLRAGWRSDAELTYVGKRQATLGKRNDVVKLTYKDGFIVEFEFADDGTPVKAIHKRVSADGNEITEEDRYAQFVEIAGVRTPFIIDRFTNGQPSSRINYETVEFNRSVPESIFAKPSSPKEAKRDLKF